MYGTCCFEPLGSGRAGVELQGLGTGVVDTSPPLGRLSGGPKRPALGRAPERTLDDRPGSPQPCLQRCYNSWFARLFFYEQTHSFEKSGA